MIYSLRGNLIVMEQGFSVIECSGVGYKCNTSINTQKSLKLNSEVTLFTYMSVREDACELFGFATKAELQCFKLLIGVSGVGPKVGIALLSDLTPEQVTLAISAGDVKALTRAQGVGPKLASRIILELKDKLKGLATSDTSIELKGSVIEDTGNIPKAVAALAVLGFSSADVTPVLSKLDPSLSVEQLIGETLKKMGR
ncbi:MAG: Holliday junction branch migration protein RuvA [Clostridia bacterium]|nr:Holliday junction branch migration protein RuvA [Clostridia bacterium]